MEEDVIHCWKEALLGEIYEGFFDCQDQRGIIKTISFQQYQVVFMAPMEVQCAIGNLTVPLDSNWPFHSSHFQHFSQWCKGRTAKITEVLGKLGNQNIFNVL